MSNTIEVYGKHWFATQHAAQDRFFVQKFEHNGQEIHIGALADGCTSDVYDLDYRPEIGAKWLVREFARQVVVLYQQGLRCKDLGRKIALNILAGMRDYQPRYPRSKWDRSGYNPVCDELVATLYGFVADDENLLVVSCGDGYLIHSGKFEEIEQSGVYPVQTLIDFPEAEWSDQLEALFIIQSKDIRLISAFGIASDGLSYLDQKGIQAVLSQKGNHPKSCVDALLHLPTTPEKHDDITIVYMAVH